MALTPGSRIGSYEIGAQIGAGGMGEVYRATDTRLHRDVAIKVLPNALAGNTDRLARFQREAEVLASLNHPNIAHIYGVEGNAGSTALVMELVEGPTLADRLREGPLSLEQASAIARQLAEALDYAHERGVIHRDLKPGNLKVRPDGTVKVLDFGLAKATASTSQMTEAPTATVPQTGVGVVLGTAAYMAPEQAKGQEVDRRADIWAFGCLFYEMLAGIPPHRRNTSQETLASILRDEADLSKVPAQAHRLLKRCLEKDPQQRLRHIGDVMALLDEPPSGEHVPPPSGIGAASLPTSRSGWLWPAVAGITVLAAAAAVLVWVMGRGGTPQAQAVRFEVGETDEMRFFFGGAMAVSPDGRWLVFPATGADGVNRYYLRSLETVEARALPGTEGAYVPAAWTADSRYVIFTLIGRPELQRVDIQGGPPQTLATLAAGTTNINGAASNQNEIVFALALRGVSSAAPGVPLRRVPIAGGTPEPVTALLEGDASHQFPQFLPDERRFLYFVASSDPDRTGTYVGSLDVEPDAQSTERLLATDRQAYYAPPTGTGPGHLITLRGTTLLAQAFDPERLELSGEAVPVAQDVDSFSPRNYGLFTVSDSGALVYRGGAGSGLGVVSFDEAGRPQSSFGEPDVYRQPAVSPDGARVAVTRGADGARDIWVIDTTRDTTQRFTFDPADDVSPVWSPDGTSIAFSSNRSGQPHLYLKPADGLREEVLLTDQPGTPSSWSRDGRYLLFTSGSPDTSNDVWVLPNPGEAAARPVPLIATPYDEQDAHVSPDGRWVAYTSTESSSADVFVRPFSPDGSGGGARYLVSRGLSNLPRWMADGRLVYVSATNLEMMAVAVEPGTAFQASTPRRLFTGPSPLITVGWSPKPDGGFVFISTPADSRPAPFTVVLNWEASLDR